MSRHETAEKHADTLATSELTRNASEKFPAIPTEQATVTEPNLTPAERQTRDRDRIRKADPIGFLIKVMAGEPLPIVDTEGNVIGWERVDAIGRAAAADRLLKRIVPELKSVELNSEGGGINIVLQAPFAVPGSARQNDPHLIEASIMPHQINQSLQHFAEAITEEDQQDDR